MMLACGAAKPEDCALNVYATVVSRAAPERGILDSGSKTLTADSGALNDGFGLILEYPQAKIAAFAEEHGFLDLSRSNARPKVGEVVRVIPNHVCVVVNMVDRMIAVRGDKDRRRAACGGAGAAGVGSRFASGGRPPHPRWRDTRQTARL